MTTTSQGRLSRRSFLAAMTVVGVAAGGGLGLVVAGARSAAAATGATITWRISSEPVEARRDYANMLNAIRLAVRGGRLDTGEHNGERGRPLDVTDNGGALYIGIDIHAEDRTEFIRVFMRRRDSYVLGWRQGVEADGGAVTWGNIFTLDRDVRPILDDGSDNPERLPGSTADNTDTRYDTLANYSDLEHQGAHREGMQISPSSLNAAVLRLQAGAETPIQYVAQSVLQIIVGLAEGSRMREQARETANAFGRGVAFTLTPTHIAFHNKWFDLSRATLLAIMAGTSVLSAPLEIGGVVIATTVAAAYWLMTAHHSKLDTKGRHLAEGTLLSVSADGVGDHWTVQAAIDAAPDQGTSILIEKGVYHEVISVPSDKSWLTIKGVTGDRTDVVIHNSRCHGMINPSTGAKYSTQGSAVATFRAPNLTVQDLTIANTFDRDAHPEISPYETQAVAVAAMGDRQVYDNVSIMSHQDTLLVKGETPTTQARQYFYNCFIRGDVDFIFGNATAVIDRSRIQELYWPGGTVLAPNTDYRKKYGILITDSEITGDGKAPVRSMYLGRPWHNAPEVWPQAVVRNTVVYPQVNDTQPWIDMMPDYPWQRARFKEYRNSGLGAGAGDNAPKLTDAEAAEYTAHKYLAGTDGWNPVR